MEEKNAYRMLVGTRYEREDFGGLGLDLMKILN
jgi:hypothetical protein